MEEELDGGRERKGRGFEAGVERAVEGVRVVVVEVDAFAVLRLASSAVVGG